MAEPSVDDLLAELLSSDEDEVNITQKRTGLLASALSWYSTGFGVVITAFVCRLKTHKRGKNAQGVGYV